MSDLRNAFQNKTVRSTDDASLRDQGHLLDYFQPRPRSRLMREQALAIVRNAIVEGKIEPGTRLVERELCEALEVSRTVIREVIRDLRAERLIEVAAHRGPSVARLTPRKVREIYAIRAELEALFLREFIRVADQAQLATLRRIFEDLRVAGQQHDKGRLIEISTRFLGHMVQVADNQVGAEMYDQLLSRINMLRNISMSQPGQIDNSIEQFGKLMHQIEARNAAAAEAILRTYTLNAGESAIARLTQQPTRKPATRGGAQPAD